MISESLAITISQATNTAIIPCTNTFVGVGGAPVTFSGIIKLRPTFSTFTAPTDIDFLVTSQVTNHAFLGLADQIRFGMVINMASETVLCQGHTIPFKFTLESLLAGWAAFQQPKQVRTEPVKIVLHISVNIPSNDTALAVGIIQNPAEIPALKGKLCYVDPVELRQGYGMIAVRVLCHVSKDGKVFLLIRNPLPIGVHLLPRSKVGFLYEAEVVESLEFKTMGTDLDSSPDDHPLDKVDLSHLDACLCIGFMSCTVYKITKE